MDEARQGRGRNRQWTLRPQDLVLALKLVLLGQERLSYALLAEQLHLSPFEAHAAAKRLVAARLAGEDNGSVQPLIRPLERFVRYGAVHAFPAVRGGMTIGFPTAYGVPPLKDLMLFPNEIAVPVWPHPEGEVRGLALLPLYPKLPLAARDDRPLYEMLALFDALRIGQAREREIAEKHLHQRFQQP
jgi:hypothetical protein